MLDLMNSGATQLASLIALNLTELGYPLPNDEQLFTVIKKCDNTSDVAHGINEYYVSLLKEALLNQAGTYRTIVEKLLNVQYGKQMINPSEDLCYIYFLHYVVKNPTTKDIKTFCNYMNYYIFNLCLGGVNGHTTFSVTLPQQAIDKLTEEKLDRYMCPLMFRSDEKNSQPSIKGYLLNVGLMRQHDTETKNRFDYFQRSVEVIHSYNQFILHTEDFLPDYLIINLAEE